MCQSKAEGGKRCANGMLGSRATINTVVQTLRERPEDVKAVFTELRHEGKNLPKPTPEQVAAFAAQQRFQANWNPELTTSAKERIATQWENAPQDEPDGGTFHAWKNTLGEVARRARAKLAAVTAITGLSMALASCSGGGTLASTTPDPSIAPSTPAIAQTLNYAENAKVGIVAGQQRTDQFGTYSQVSLSDTAPVLAFDASRYDAASQAAFTSEQLTDAQSATARFVAQSIMDNPAVYDQSAENLAAYSSESTPFVADAQVQEWQSDVLAGGQGVATDAIANRLVLDNPGAKPEGYSAGQSRYLMNKFEVQSVTTNSDKGDIVYTYNVDYDRGFTDVDGSKVDMHMTGTYKIAVAPDANGTWKMTGWGQDLHSEIAK